VFARALAVSRFAIDLSELCGAEGEWLAILALAPRVLHKFGDDFSQLAAALDSFAETLSNIGDSSSAGKKSQVAAQPSATAESPGVDQASQPYPVQEGVFAETTGRVSALSAMVITVSEDLKADLEGEKPLGSSRLKPELEVSVELHRRLLSSSKGATPDTKGSEVALLERLAGLSGTGAANRPLQALSRELEAAKQFCRMLEGQDPPRSTVRADGAEHRLPAGGRDALVSETQASGGSALHRWIRAQVADPHGDGAGSGSSGSFGRIERAGSGAFVKLADIPHEFLCPITQDVMRDAVSTCDGHTYERRNIEAWLAENSTSPITGLPLANKTLIPNHNLRKLILDSGVLSRLEPDAKPDTEAVHGHVHIVDCMPC
jgi:hypothetical protein